MEPPEKDSQLMGLFMAPKLLATTGEKRPGQGRRCPLGRGLARG